MIRFDVTGRNFEVDDKLHEYVDEKLGGLEKYVPRGARASVHGVVVLEDDPSGREDNRYVCEAILNVRGEQLMSREGTLNMYAAIDIVEAKLKAQLVKYKEKHSFGPRRARMLGRWLSRRSEAEGVEPVEPEEEAA
jgi:ribosome hibernation promoting factor